MLILSLSFWRRAESTCWCPHLSLSRSKKYTSQSSAMSPVSQYIHILATTTVFSKMSGVWKAFSHLFLLGHFELWLFYCSSICAARETVHLFKGPTLYCFSSISHSCQRSNSSVFDMHCYKPIHGPEFQLSKSRSIELYLEQSVFGACTFKC